LIRLRRLPGQGHFKSDKFLFGRAADIVDGPFSLMGVGTSAVAIRLSSPSAFPNDGPCDLD
jgi:hypothetical protein